MCMRVLATSFPICVLLFLLGVWTDSNGGLKHLDAFAGDSAQTSAIDGISTTVDNQILVELMPEDATPANLFDLNERTLVFTPDGEGEYSREVQPLAWEEHLGAVVEGRGHDCAGELRIRFCRAELGFVLCQPSWAADLRWAVYICTREERCHHG